MNVQAGKDPEKWNAIVDKSPYSVLFHRYESLSFMENPLPLLVTDGGHCFLFPLNFTRLFKSFRLAISPIHDYASILPDTENYLDFMPQALDHVADFLLRMEVDYLSTCVPTFWSRAYTNSLNSWFSKRKADVQVMYAHMIRIGDATFQEVWKHRFSKKAREKIRKADMEGVHIIEIDSGDDIRRWIEDIYQCNLSALKRQGRQGAYPDSHKEVYLSELVSTKKCLGKYFKIYGAIARGRLIAYMIVQECNKLAEVTKAMSHTKFLNKCPNEALLSYIIRKSCERGFRFFEYGLDRAKIGGKIPSLHPTLIMFRSKFGFEEIPIPIYRLGLTRSGRAIQHLYSKREYAITQSARFPECFKRFAFQFYAPSRRRLSAFLSG